MVFQKKTLKEHREYLYEIVKLKLFFLHHWLRRHPEETFRDAIRTRVDIYRKTDANPGGLNPDKLYFDAPAWLALEDAASRLYENDKIHADSFEKRAFDIFKPSIDARCKRDYEDQTAAAGYQCGCFRHDLEIFYPEQKALGFHIMNSLSPDSFLDHPDYVKACFLKLLNIAEQQFHAVRILTCTWLNSHPKWLAFFPEDWLKNMSEEDKSVQWHYGFWGQFISARGTFNYKYGQYLRRTGCMPFYPRTSCCSIESMRDKLNEIETGKDTKQ